MGNTTKRTVLTQAERIAKLEAELAAAKAKQDERNQKTGAVLREQRSKLVEQIIERRDKIRAINAQLEELDPEDRFDWSSVGVEETEPEAEAPAEDDAA